MNKAWVRRTLAEVAVGFVWIGVFELVLTLGAPEIVAVGILLIGADLTSTKLGERTWLGHWARGRTAGRRSRTPA